MSASLKNRVKKLETAQQADWESLLPPGLDPDTVVRAFTLWIADEWPEATPPWKVIRQRFSQLCEAGTLPESLQKIITLEE